MKRFTKLISALLLMCILLSAVSCANENKPVETKPKSTTSASTTTPTTTSASTTAPEPPLVEPVSFKLTENFMIVRPAEPDTVEMDAARLLSKGIRSAYGFSCTTVSDFAPGGKVNPNEFEILVGNTNRNESKSLYSELAYYDYKYDIVSENVIAICGGSPEATYAAVESFLNDILGYKEDKDTEEVISEGTDATLTTGTSKISVADYPVTSLKIGERDFSEYTIVTTNTSYNGVSIVVEGFSRLCGKKIPVISLSEYKSGPAIFLGCYNTKGEHYPSSVYGQSRYYITESDENIFIDFKTQKASAPAAKRFISEYLPDNAKGSVTINLKGADALATGIGIESESNDLVLKESTTETLAEGVYYTEQVFYDPNGKPVRTYAITVKKGAASIITSLPAGGVGSITNVKNMLLAEREAGKNAIAAVNADFYDLGGTNIMKGLCIVDGEELHPTGVDEWFGKSWFGITKDGEAVIGTTADYKKYEGNLQHAVGGSNIVLRKDFANDLRMGEEFSYIRHPRTAVGIKPNGDVVLIVIDGRQPSISNGAAMSDLAFILSTFGCCDAVNLDGGGSSGLVISDSEGNVTTMNSPSDGGLRSVANGLTVVLP